MDSPSIHEFIDDYELPGNGIDYDFLCEILNNETQEISTQNNLNLHSQLSAANNFDIAELDLDVEPQLYKNGRWVRRRRRLKKGTQEYVRRKQEIKLQNRMSARKSIEKKEAYIRELEEKVKKLKAENDFRRKVLQFFPNSKPAGRLCGLRRCFSTSDFYINAEVTNEEEASMKEI